jgi:hypothetical protein
LENARTAEATHESELFEQRRGAEMRRREKSEQQNSRVLDKEEKERMRVRGVINRKGEANALQEEVAALAMERLEDKSVQRVARRLEAASKAQQHTEKERAGRMHAHMTSTAGRGKSLQGTRDAAAALEDKKEANRRTKRRDMETKARNKEDAAYTRTVAKIHTRAMEESPLSFSGPVPPPTKAKGKPKRY